MNPRLLWFFIVLGLIGGFWFSADALRVFEARNAPIVSGRVIARTPVRESSVPRVDFTIQITGLGTKVHAHTGRYLMNKIPDVVRFHYTGNPERDVFLFEHEHNPYWIVALFWGAALIFIALVASPRLQKALGWSGSEPHETGL